MGAYAWANNPTAKNYTPDKAHQFNAVSGEKLTAQYSNSAQVYTLTLPNPDNVVFKTYLVMVTATGANGEYCDGAGGVNVFTGELRQSFFCYDPVGIRINTPYAGMLMFSR